MKLQEELSCLSDHEETLPGRWLGLPFRLTHDPGARKVLLPLRHESLAEGLERSTGVSFS